MKLNKTTNNQKKSIWCYNNPVEQFIIRERFYLYIRSNILTNSGTYAQNHSIQTQCRGKGIIRWENNTIYISNRIQYRIELWRRYIVHMRRLLSFLSYHIYNAIHWGTFQFYPFPFCETFGDNHKNIILWILSCTNIVL